MSNQHDTNDLPDLDDEELLENMLDKGRDEAADKSRDTSKIEIEVDTPIDALGDEVATLKEQLKQAEDRFLRSEAELENFRRRSRRELEEERRFANQPLLTDLFPVIDNIDRAIVAAEQGSDASGLLEGFKMVAQQLSDTLEKHHCTPIDAIGKPFDPALHEAILQQPSEDPRGTVIFVALQGYQLHDRVIRPTQVIVSTGSAQT